eukprot:TRINITY_DN2350_c1_g1_i7.p1 TRINITY_DN2350_c1_g1~~TRINITY_DN2350_c1_g1_i7.p1  ORF type:complete len:197 (+),score=49.26 TRINITY_DN2350_c1_g1_i7:352-942(+)
MNSNSKEKELLEKYIQKSVEMKKRLKELQMQISEISEQRLLDKEKWDREFTRLTGNHKALVLENKGLRNELSEYIAQEEINASVNDEIEVLKQKVLKYKMNYKEIREEMMEEVNSERRLANDLYTKNRLLEKELELMNNENQSLRASLNNVGNLTQTDHLNRQLLESYFFIPSEAKESRFFDFVGDFSSSQEDSWD